MHVLSHSKITVEHWFLFFSLSSFLPFLLEINLKRVFRLVSCAGKRVFRSPSSTTLNAEGEQENDIYIYISVDVNKKRRITSERDVGDMRATEREKVVKSPLPPPASP